MKQKTWFLFVNLMVLILERIQGSMYSKHQLDIIRVCVDKPIVSVQY